MTRMPEVSLDRRSDIISISELTDAVRRIESQHQVDDGEIRLGNSLLNPWIMSKRLPDCFLIELDGI